VKLGQDVIRVVLHTLVKAIALQDHFRANAQGKTHQRQAQQQ